MEKEFDFNVGDPVWIMHNNIAVQGTIKTMWYTEFISPVNCDLVQAESYVIDLNGSLVGGVDRNQIFTSKKDLIKSL